MCQVWKEWRKRWNQVKWLVFYIEGKTEELLRKDKNAQKINMCNQYANFAHICTNMCRELCKKLCKEIISHAHQERWDGGNRQKMSGIQHGEKEMEEKDELTCIRKRNRSVHVFVCGKEKMRKNAKNWHSNCSIKRAESMTSNVQFNRRILEMEEVYIVSGVRTAIG